jgi:hypothetical protein
MILRAQVTKTVKYSYVELYMIYIVTCETAHTRIMQLSQVLTLPRTFPWVLRTLVPLKVAIAAHNLNTF